MISERFSATACHPASSPVSPHQLSPGVPPQGIPVWLIVGLPNSGKSSLFVHLTGVRQRIVNFPGTTVEFTVAYLRKHPPLLIMDTPGIYSLESTRDPDEDEIRVLRNILQKRHWKDYLLEGVIVVMDAMRLTMSFSLLREVQKTGLPVVPVVTHVDQLSPEFVRRVEFLFRRAFTVNARTGEGVDRVRQHLEACSRQNPPYACPVAICAGCPLWTHSYQKRILHQEDRKAHRVHQKIDQWILKPWVGYPLILLMVWGIFHLLFTVGGALAEWTGETLDFLYLTVQERWFTRDSSGTGLHLLTAFFTALSSILVFLPQIILLFLILALLEDSGILARMSLLLEAPLRRLGFSGTSLLPILSGVACNIPALLSVRTVRESRIQKRLLWMLPLVPCSARLPVFVLLIALLIPPIQVGGIDMRALALMGVYAFVFGVLFLLGALWKFLEDRSPSTRYLAMSSWVELPPYQIPALKTVGVWTWLRTRDFLLRAGKVIFVIAVILWGLGHIAWNSGNLVFTDSVDASLLAEAGKKLAPVFAPLGFTWQMAVGILSAFWAREVFIVTLGALYGLSETEAETVNLVHLLAGDPAFHPASAISLLVFFSFAILCMGTFAVLIRLHPKKWYAWVQLGISLAFAYGMAWVGFEIARNLLPS